MATSLSSLLTTVTEEQALDLALDQLEVLGFNARSWQDGSVSRTLVQLVANLYASLSATIPQIAAGGFTRTAAGAWLDLLSEDFFDNVRVAAVTTQGVIRLTSSPTAPPHTIAVGDLQIADTATATGSTHTYRNTAGGSLGPGAVLDLDVEGETAGADWNIANGSTLYMWTALVGVTATNPAVGSTGTWITRAGTDAETDARLRERDLSRWSTLSYAAVEGAYRNWALEADSAITRVRVRANNPYGPGTVDVVCATAIGGISPTQAADVLDYINGADGTGRRPLGDVVTVQSASAIAFTVSGTVTVESAFQATTTATAIQTAILDVLNETDIGGTVIPPATTGVIVHSKMVAAVEALAGVISVNITTPSGDFALTELQVVGQSAVSFTGLTVVYG